MASEQVIVNETVAKAVVEASRVAIQAMTVTAAETSQSTAGPKIGRPAKKQPAFNWEADDKYNKLKTFRLEVNNVLSTYNTPQTEELTIVKNWIGRNSLQFLESLTNEEKVMCSMLEGLFETLTNTFSPQLKETIKSLQFCKLSQQDGESTEEWMGRL